MTIHIHAKLIDTNGALGDCFIRMFYFLFTELYFYSSGTYVHNKINGIYTYSKIKGGINHNAYSTCVLRMLFISVLIAWHFELLA